jgi:hypothetical protein
MKPLRWQAQGSFTAFVLAKDGKKLVFVVTESSAKWSAIALETEGNNIDAALASHAHQLLGEFDTVSEAFTACETYAEKWRAGKRADPCGCEEIETPVKIDAEFEEAPVVAHVEGKTEFVPMCMWEDCKNIAVGPGATPWGDLPVCYEHARAAPRVGEPVEIDTEFEDVDGSVCGCGRPSIHESGWCGTHCEALREPKTELLRGLASTKSAAQIAGYTEPESQCTCDAGPGAIGHRFDCALVRGSQP